MLRESWALFLLPEAGGLLSAFLSEWATQGQLRMRKRYGVGNVKPALHPLFPNPSGFFSRFANCGGEE